jgi:hypothetical protein
VAPVALARLPIAHPVIGNHPEARNHKIYAPRSNDIRSGKLLW